jgi:hypothetical protein
LLHAAARAEPMAGRHFLARLRRLTRGGVVDVALEYGGAGAPPLAYVARDMAIYAPCRSEEQVAGCCTDRHIGQLADDVAASALATWRVFVRHAGLAGMEAEASTDGWITRRQRLHLVGRAGSAF